MNNRHAPYRRGISKKAMIIICCVLLLVFAVLLVVASQIGKGGTPDNPKDHTSSQSTEDALPLPEMVIRTIEEQGDIMKVTTSYGVFSYPFAFSDIVTIEASNQDGAVGLTFSANINDSLEPMYHLWVNSDKGVLAGVLRVEDQNYRISVELKEPRDDLDEAYLLTFRAAQETLNDVLQSMVASGAFSYTEGD